jgi:FkbM family methyltransferase
MSTKICEDSRSRLNRLFVGMKQEGVETRRLRASAHYDGLAGTPDAMILFGAGLFGRYTLQHLRRMGQAPAFFSDNKPTLWGTRVEGIEILNPTEAVSRFGATAAFVVTIFNGSAARRQLRDAGARHVMSVMTLPWKYPEHFIPDFGLDAPDSLLAEEEPIRACFESLSDERSRQELCDQVEWRYWLEPESIPFSEPVAELYFPSDLLIPSGDEVLVDCGAFDGDTIRSLVERRQDFRHLYALEPDPGNRAALGKYLATQSEDLRSRITVLPYGVSDADETVRFAASSDVTSRVVSSGEGISLECRKLDSLRWPVKPTYIKMDIEGSEPKALAGAAGLLRDEPPVLAICLYHRSEHLWQIPNLIHRLQPNYSLFLRRYAEDNWESVCYAIPRHRLRSQG